MKKIILILCVFLSHSIFAQDNEAGLRISQNLVEASKIYDIGFSEYLIKKLREENPLALYHAIKKIDEDQPMLVEHYRRSFLDDHFIKLKNEVDAISKMKGDSFLINPNAGLRIDILNP